MDCTYLLVCSQVRVIWSLLMRVVRDQPYIATLLLTLGLLSVARVLYQTLVVFFQTFVLPGASVRHTMQYQLIDLIASSAQAIRCQERRMGGRDGRNRRDWQGIFVATGQIRLQHIAGCTKQAVTC